MVDPSARATMLFVARRWRELADEDDPTESDEITPDDAHRGPKLTLEQT